MPGSEPRAHLLSLDAFASVCAALDAGSERAEALAEAGISTEAWEEEQEAWLGELAAQASRGLLLPSKRYVELFDAKAALARTKARKGPKRLEGPIPVIPSAMLSPLSVGYGEKLVPIAVLGPPVERLVPSPLEPLAPPPDHLTPITVEEPSPLAAMGKSKGTIAFAIPAAAHDGLPFAIPPPARDALPFVSPSTMGPQATPNPGLLRSPPSNRGGLPFASPSTMGPQAAPNPGLLRSPPSNRSGLPFVSPQSGSPPPTSPEPSPPAPRRGDRPVTMIGALPSPPASALPFTRPSPGSSAPPPPPSSTGKTRTRIADDGEVPVRVGSGLPFAKSSAAPPSDPSHGRPGSWALPFQQQASGAAPRREEGPSSLAQTASGQQTKPDAYTLVGYANLCAGIRANPANVAWLRQRYGLSEETWVALHGQWQGRLQRDPALRAQWERLIAESAPYWKR